jgi:hypothetical protein
VTTRALESGRIPLASGTATREDALRVAVE